MHGAGAERRAHVPAQFASVRTKKRRGKMNHSRKESLDSFCFPVAPNAFDFVCMRSRQANIDAVLKPGMDNANDESR